MSKFPQLQLVYITQMGDDTYHMFHVRFFPKHLMHWMSLSRSSIGTGRAAGSYSAANDQMSSLWHVQNDPFPNLTWATVSWNMGAALFPLLFVPLTENLYELHPCFIH